MKRIPYGPYMPDLPPVVNQQGLITARNVVPINGGYGPQASLATVTDATPLSAYARGALGGIDFGGNPFNVAGDQTKLYSTDSGGASDKSRASGYQTGEEGRWEFAAFGETVFATNFNEDLQFIDAKLLPLTGELFADVSGLGVAPAVPRARHIGVIDNFLVLGNIFDSVIGNQPGAISWSAINNPLSWPTRGTDGAVAVQSDHQILEGNGGWVQAVVPGSEVGAIFQEHAIWRMDYVGGDVVFALRRVEPNRGLLIPGLAVAVSRWVFYLSEDGFYLFDYTSSKPIGKDRINDTFFADYDNDFPDRVTAIRDPDATRIYVLYPGSGNVNGTPNKMLTYDWALDLFSHSDIDAEVLTWALVSGANLDAPDNPPDDPDELEDPPQDVETFDVRISPPGSLQLGAYNTSHVLSSFTGVNLVGTLETGDIECAPGGRFFVREVRPIVDSSDATIQIATTGRKNEGFVFGQISKQDDDGKCPVRSDGRYHRFRTNLPSAFTSAVGMDIEGRASGRK